MKIKFIFAWYDLWIGIFIDKKKKCVYFFPVPMFGLKISWEENECADCEMYWWERDYWGECDEGCHCHRNISYPCYLPKMIRKIVWFKREWLPDWKYARASEKEWKAWKD